MMSRLRNTAPIALLGIVCVAASYLPVAPIALLAALVAVLLLPAWAAARYAAANGAAGDALERSAYAYGGLALSCWSLWVIGSSIGLSRPLIVAAPVIGAVALTMVGGLQPSPAGPESDSADAGSDSGSSRQRHGARPERFAVILTAVTLAVLVIIPFLPYGWVGSDGVHRMAMTDWYKHLMVTTALDTADRLPPANPFLISDDNTAYYYGFHLATAAIKRARLQAAVGDEWDPDPRDAMPGVVPEGPRTALVLVVLEGTRALPSDSRRAAVAAIRLASLLAVFAPRTCEQHGLPAWSAIGRRVADGRGPAVGFAWLAGAWDLELSWPSGSTVTSAHPALPYVAAPGGFVARRHQAAGVRFRLADRPLAFTATRSRSLSPGAGWEYACTSPMDDHLPARLCGHVLADVAVALDLRRVSRASPSTWSWGTSHHQPAA